MTLTPRAGTSPRFNETTIAIFGAFVVAVVLSSFIINPFRAMVLAYTDYSNTTAAPDVPPASTVNAPAPAAK